MRKTRVRALHAQAFEAGKNGDLIVSDEFRRLKRSYKNKSHAKVVVQFPTKPMTEIIKKRKEQAKAKIK